MTVASFTNPNQTYETTTTSCTCPDFQYRGSKVGKPCKHMVAVAITKAVAFQALRLRYDVRLNGQAASRRCYYEMSLGY